MAADRSVATDTVDQHRLDEDVSRKACFIIGTNVPDPKGLLDQELVTTYKDQGGVELGAGSYGLFVASHLKGRGILTFIFGKPIEFWQNMPPKMYLTNGATYT